MVSAYAVLLAFAAVHTVAAAVTSEELEWEPIVLLQSNKPYWSPAKETPAFYSVSRSDVYDSASANESSGGVLSLNYNQSMFESLDALNNGGDWFAVTLYPDSTSRGISANDPAKSWSNFDELGWDGDLASLPEMVPAEYVAAVQSMVDDGSIPTADCAGVWVLLDWEKGHTRALHRGLHYYRDETLGGGDPKPKQMADAVIRQTASVVRTLKAAFPKAKFGTYGAETNLPHWVSEDIATGHPSTSTTGIKKGRIAYAGDVLKQTLLQNVVLACGPELIPALDFHAIVSYDYYSPHTDKQWAAVDPIRYLTMDQKHETVRLRVAALKLANTTHPILALVSPAVYSQPGSPAFNTPGANEWADRATWMSHTVAMVANANGFNGFMFWDGLTEDTSKHVFGNRADYAAAQVVTVYLEDKLRWNTFKTLPGFLDAVAELHGTTSESISTVQGWFDNLSLAQRTSQETLFAYHAAAAAAYKTYLIPELLKVVAPSQATCAAHCNTPRSHGGRRLN